MNKLNSKLLLIPIFLFLILLFVYFAFILSKKNLPTSPSFPFSPSPTLNKLQIQQKKTTPSPTLIPPAFTGAAKDPQISQEDIDITTQKYFLRKTTPLKQSNFSIFFDYSLDKFNVILQEPKDITQASFSAWLDKNYSSIPLDRFIIK